MSDKKQARLSIVILNHNTRRLLADCLATIPNNPEYETVVVDNASSDGSVEMIRQQFPAVRLVARKVNDGYTRGNNAAKKIVSGDYVLFLNSDTRLENGALETCLDYLVSHASTGAVTGLVTLANGELYYACHRGFPTPWNSLCYFTGLSRIFPKIPWFSGYSLSHLPLNEEHEIDSCSGTFLMIKKPLLDKIGWFDEDYFAFGEDIEMCFQVKRAGYKVMFLPGARIIHYWGASSGLKSSSQEVTQASLEIKRQWTMARFDAMKIFYDKHYAKSYPAIVRGLVFLAINIKEQLALKNL